MISRWIVAVVAAALAGSWSLAMADGLVTGTASFRERIAPPPEAAFEAVIEDVSRADAPSIVIGRTVVANAGTPPYDFSIEYDPAEIDERHTYSVRTRLVDGERLLFTSDTMHPVITRGAPLVVDVRMVKAESDGSPVPSRTIWICPPRSGAIFPAPTAMRSGTRSISGLTTCSICAGSGTERTSPRT